MIWVLLALVVRGSAPPIEAGYYHSIGYDYGDHLEALPPEARLAHVRVDTGTVGECAELAARCAARGLRVVYGAHEVAFGRSEGGYRLRNDWRRRWTLQLPCIAHFVARGAFHSVYLADEPHDHGITTGELAEVTAWLQGRGLRVTVVETMGWARAPRPPYDYFGLTCYRDQSGIWSVDWAACYRAYRAARANLVVGASFQWAGQSLAVADAVQSWRLAERLRVRAVLWFLWPSVVGLSGAESAPDVVAAQRRLMARRPTWEASR